jgi:hypothetical protein
MNPQIAHMVTKSIPGPFPGSPPFAQFARFSRPLRTRLTTDSRPSPAHFRMPRLAFRTAHMRFARLCGSSSGCCTPARQCLFLDRIRASVSALKPAHSLGFKSIRWGSSGEKNQAHEMNHVHQIDRTFDGQVLDGRVRRPHANIAPCLSKIPESKSKKSGGLSPEQLFAFRLSRRFGVN